MKIHINWNLTKELITFYYSISWWQCWNITIKRVNYWCLFAFFWIIHKTCYLSNGEDGTESASGKVDMTSCAEVKGYVCPGSSYVH
jgi:hypothetical protein